MDLINQFKQLFKPEVKIDPATFNDPLALKTSWEPLVFGGNRGINYVAVEENNSVIFKKTTISKLFPLIVIIFVSWILYYPISEVINTASILELLKKYYLYVIGYFAFIIIVFLISYFSGSNVYLDKNYGYAWKSRKKTDTMPDFVNIKKKVKLDEIHAIQIISERVKVNENRGNFTSFEINLILKSAERFNVVDQSNYRFILKDAELLSKFLSVPIWDGVDSRFKEAQFKGF